MPLRRNSIRLRKRGACPSRRSCLRKTSGAKALLLVLGDVRAEARTYQVGVKQPALPTHAGCYAEAGSRFFPVRVRMTEGAEKKQVPPPQKRGRDDNKGVWRRGIGRQPDGGRKQILRP